MSKKRKGDELPLEKGPGEGLDDAWWEDNLLREPPSAPDDELSAVVGPRRRVGEPSSASDDGSVSRRLPPWTSFRLSSAPDERAGEPSSAPDDGLPPCLIVG